MQRLLRGPREGWLSLILLMAVVLIPAISLAESAWVADLEIIPWLAFAGVILGTILAKTRVRWLVSHLFAIEIGIVAVGYYFASLAEKGDWNERVAWLWGRIYAWLEVVFGGGMSSDGMLFALVMALTAWSMGYVAAWFVFRRQNAWPALLACGSGLLINLSYAAPNSLTYFVVFMLVSMLLLIRITLSQRVQDWEKVDADYAGGLTFGSIWKGAALSMAIMAFAWTLPTGVVQASLAESWYQMTGPWQGLQTEFDRLFASVGATNGKVEGNRFSKTLALKGAIELGQDPVLLVSSPKPEYWATQSYDRYTGQGWMSSAEQSARLDANDQKLASTSMYKGREDIEQRFKLLIGRSNSIFAANSPVRLSLPVYADNYGSLDELASLRATIPMRQSQQYAVISSVSVATADQLRGAGTEYPEWTKRYLDLPQTTPRRLISQTRRVVRQAENPYDAASIIQDYLRGFKYELKVTQPPPDRDAVDYFLFVSKEGYCDYFASAMAVMARTLGIPSRVVSGYNTGTFNEQSGLYEVRLENAHSWPELFFPEYGWVRFEPTPSQPVVERPLTATDEESTLSAEGIESDAAALGLDTSARDQLLYSDNFDMSDSGIAFADTTTESADEPVSLAIPGAILALVGTLLLIRKLLLARLSVSGRSYLEMSWLAGLLGWRLKPSYTPAEYGRVLGQALPEMRPKVEAIVDSYTEETYARRASSRDDTVEESWRQLRFRLPLALLRHRIKR